MAYLSGKSGTLSFGGSALDLAEWDAEISAANAKGATSNTAGWQVTAEGIHSWSMNFTVVAVAGSVAACSGFREGALGAVVAGTGGGGISGNVRVDKIGLAVRIMGTEFVSFKCSGTGDGVPTLT